MLSKTSATGLAARAELLAEAGIQIDGLEMWSHDSLDAALAALIARRVEAAEATPVACGHDGSAIWLSQMVQSS